jgi:type II secretory pathway pseudopilin PulG
MRAGREIGVRPRSLLALRARDRGLTPISQRGFTYLALLLIVSAMGGGFAAYGELASRSIQREKEAELLFVGNEYRRAIGTYYESSPAGHKRWPKSLEALLKDDRFAFNRRHLRKLYRDPVTGGSMEAVEAPEGGIMGVRSPSTAAPLKSGNFLPEDAAFEAAPSLADWQFVYSPLPSPSGPTASR